MRNHPLRPVGTTHDEHVAETREYAPVFPIFAGETASAFGIALTAFVVPLFLAQDTELTPFQISIVLAASTSAPLVLALSSGAIADKYDRKRFLLLCDLGRAALIAAFALLYIGGVLPFWLMAVILFLIAVLGLLFDAAMTSTIPVQVPPERLVRANSILGGGRSAAGLSAPLIGGGLLSVLSAPVAFLFNAATYLISTVTLLRVPAGRTADVTDELQQSHLADIRDGIVVLWHNHIMRSFLLSTGAYNFFQS